jgi:high-affinity iron transporter
VEARVASRLDRAAQRQVSAGWSLLALVAVSILREGIETILFLSAAGSSGIIAGSAIGLVAAAGIAAVFLLSTRGVSLRGFFAATNVLLILFAAGLVSRGAHELVEAGVLPPLVERLWDLNPPLRADGGYPALHQRGALGGILRGLFGYAAAPSLVEIIGWAACAAAAVGVWAGAARRRSSAEA